MRSGLIIVLLFISGFAYCQNDKIYLKNGGRLKGEVTDVNLKDTLEILISNNIIQLPLPIVEEVRFHRRGKIKPQAYKDFTYEQGLYKTFSFGVLLGDHSYYDPVKAYVQLEGLIEYHHHPILNFGVGTGINEYDLYLISPLYLQYKAVMGRKTKAFYIYGRVGYGFILGKDVDENVSEIYNGRLLAGGVGYQRKIGSNFLSFQIGYHSQRITEEIIHQPWNWGWHLASDELTRIRNMNRLVLSVSYTF